MSGRSLNSESGMAIKSMVLAILAIVLLAALSVPFYRSLKVKSLQSEAQLMLAYMGTLETAYHVDSGKYVHFEEFYGSTFQGQDNCTRPAGAVELGFILKNCEKDPRSGGLRYAYRIVGKSESEYEIEAKSGSDITGESFICIGSTSFDEWRMKTDKVSVNSSFCD